MARAAVKYTPRSYQKRVRDFFLDHPRCAAWLEMGLGKTAATLDAVKALIWMGEVNQVLVVAPLRVATMTWPEELMKWDDFHELTYTVVRGTPKARMFAAQQDTDIHLINPEMLPWLVGELGKPKKWPYDMIVVDEPRGVREATSAGFKALKQVMRLSRRHVQLTGTPAPNGLAGLWGPMFLLDGGTRLGTTSTGFKQRWFYSNSETRQLTPRRHAEEQIKAAVADITIAMKTEDYIELPPLVYNNVEFDMPDKAMALYRELEEEMFVRLEESEQRIEAVNAAVLTNKCLQCSNGAAYLSDENGHALKEWAPVHNAKLDALQEVIESAQGSPVLVAYAYRCDLERLIDRFPKAEFFDKDPDQLKRWNAGKIPLLLAHPKSAGHGLNMQNGGHDLVWFGMNWSLELYAQMNKRLHRSGQTQRVTVHHLMARGTLDATVLERLSTKASVQDLLFQRAKAQGRRVRAA